MTKKDKILAVVESLPDDVSYDDAIERLDLLRRIELGLAQADRGEVVDHDEFMEELMSLDRTVPNR